MSRTLSASSCLLIALLVAHPAGAQYRSPYPFSNLATGERYHVEFAAGFWNPAPESIYISTEALGIVGTRIDGISDLGFAQTRFSDFRIVLRPATKHRFRIEYVPIKYEAEAVLTRDITFNGTTYHVGIPVNSSLAWKAWHFGYEYDFLYRDRWFVGFLVQARWTDVQAELTSPIATESAHARAPVPAIGGIARVYVLPYVSVTGQLVGFKLPESVDKERRYGGRVLDWDIGGTVNFTNNVGAQIGYRSFDVDYRFKTDTGDFKLGGFYFGAVGRF